MRLCTWRFFHFFFDFCKLLRDQFFNCENSWYCCEGFVEILPPYAPWFDQDVKWFFESVIRVPSQYYVFVWCCWSKDFSRDSSSWEELNHKCLWFSLMVNDPEFATRDSCWWGKHIEDGRIFGFIIFVWAPMSINAMAWTGSSFRAGSKIITGRCRGCISCCFGIFVILKKQSSLSSEDDSEESSESEYPQKASLSSLS